MFVQLNQELTAFQRQFIDQVKRCNALERTLEFFQEVIEQYEIPMHVSENQFQCLTFVANFFVVAKFCGILIHNHGLHIP